MSDECRAAVAYRDGPLYEDWERAVKKYKVFDQARTDVAGLRRELNSDWWILTPIPEILATIKTTCNLVNGLIKTVSPGGRAVALAEEMGAVGKWESFWRRFDQGIKKGSLNYKLASDQFGAYTFDLIADQLGQVGAATKTLKELTENLQRFDEIDSGKRAYRKVLQEETDRLDRAMADYEARLAEVEGSMDVVNGIKNAIDSACNKPEAPVNPVAERPRRPDLDAALEVVNEANRDAGEDASRRQQATDSMVGEDGPGESPGSTEPCALPVPEELAGAARLLGEISANPASFTDQNLVERCNTLVSVSCNYLRQLAEQCPEQYARQRASIPPGLLDPCTFDCSGERKPGQDAPPSPSPGNDQGSCRLSYEYLVVPEGRSEIRSQQMVITGAEYGGGREGVEAKRQEGIAFYRRCEDRWPRRSYPSEQAWHAYLAAQSERCRRIVANLQAAEVRCTGAHGG